MCEGDQPFHLCLHPKAVDAPVQDSGPDVWAGVDLKFGPVLVELAGGPVEKMLDAWKSRQIPIKSGLPILLDEKHLLPREGPGLKSEDELAVRNAIHCIYPNGENKISKISRI